MSREMDAEVAEKVFCLQARRESNPAEVAFYVEQYSTDIKAAWLVVEKMRESNPKECWVDVGSASEKHGGKWYCKLSLFCPDGEWRSITKQADTAPLAICLASLAALTRKAGGGEND